MPPPISLGLLAIVAAISCGGPQNVASRRAAHPTSPANGAGTKDAPPSIAWDYEVNVDPSLDLDIRATFLGKPGGELRVDEAAERFVDGLEVGDETAFRRVALGDPNWAATCAPASRCALRYRFHLRDAAKALHDLDTAVLAGGALVSPPSTWLVRPSEVPTARYRFHVATPPRVTFATGVRPARAPAPAGTYEGPASTLEEAAFAAFGALRVAHLADPAIERALAPELALSDDVIDKWIRAEVGAITTYFARPPDGHAMLFVTPAPDATTGGKTLGGGGASIVVRLAKNITPPALMDDWVMAHELIHVAFADLDRRHTWFSEGLATYVEPIARERAGLIAREKVWGDMLEGLPQGLAKPTDGGLDGATEWGRVYWGGALYFFLADVRIRERTSGARGLEDALRAVVAMGANVETMWPIARVIEVGDKATGTRVMHDLYEELGGARGNVDLPALLKRLGVRVEGGIVRFDDAAPLASVRDAILPRPK